tara:strand:- start:2068 stop:2457 length:390 start_codon:yes stop_codon:yes gene_type:complete
MPEKEFLGAIKLITGEEILAQVTHVFDDDGDYVIVDNPIEVEEVTMGKKQGAKVGPWMKFSNQSTFIIPKEKIVTVIECGPEVQVFYTLSLRKLNRDSSQLDVTGSNDIGRLGSVDDCRDLLEKLFKAN